MDISAIPRVTSIVLTGLDYSMKPEHARFESSKGFIKPFPELKVMHLIKSLAVTVYNQEKATPEYHTHVCDGRNSLAYFICAVHRQSAPQPMTKSHSRQNSTSSDKSSSSTSSCKLDQPGKNCQLPKLCTSSMLPLGWWDSLYYALIAEIRKLHGDLQDRFGFAGELGNPVLHHQGPDGITNQPVTATDLAFLLESAWYALMDNRLVATLDDAVRMRNLHENAAQEKVDTAVKQFINAIKKGKPDDSAIDMEENRFVWPPIVEGLVDVNALSVEEIQSRLWDKHAPEINRACLEDFEDESMLTAYRAELHAKEMEAAVAVSTPLWSASFCPCHHTCVCKLKCDEDSDECTCMNGRVQIFHQIHKQESKKQEVHTKCVKADENVPNQFLGAATNTLAQMQIAAIANPDPLVVQACHRIHETNNARELDLANFNRQRSNTNNSELAYVPASKAPGRGVKDVYPLDFYGSESPQRYPRMQAQPPTSSSFDQAPTCGSSSTKTLARKPVPPPIVTSGNHYYGKYSQPERYYQGPTPPTSSSFNTTTLIHPGPVTYPSVPLSQSEAMFTQSFPVTNFGNPREVKSNSDTYTNMQLDYSDPAQGYIGLLARHPSTIEYDEQPTATLTRPVRPSPAAVPMKAATTNDLPTLKTRDAFKEKPQPPLPEPDFISPKPATKQRYVSAGGNAKLSERAEITVPAITGTITPSGGIISKEEVDAKMSDPEWTKRNFGESALGFAPTLSPPRRSGDSSKRNGGRSSDESDRERVPDKRDRTSSGASGRVAKLKRIFSSRQNSQNETD